MCDIFVHANQYYKTLTCKVREFNYWRVDGMNFKCIFCAAVPQYALSDAGSARARMHPESMRKLRITMGAVLKIEVLHSAPSQDLSKATSPKTIELLCVAWPDSFGMLDEATLCMDASIVNDASLNLGVISTSCKILSITDSRPCASLQFELMQSSSLGSPPWLDSNSYRGLPIAPGFYFDYKTSASESSATNTQVNKLKIRCVSASPISTPCVMGPGTLFLVSKESSIAAQPSNEAIASTPIAITSGLREVVAAVVAPSLLPSIPVPAKARMQGLLLSGPPGTGKTYCIKALKEMCKNLCEVHVVELRMSDLLASEAGVSELQSALNHIDSLISAPLAKKFDAVKANSSMPNAASKDTAEKPSPTVQQKRATFASPTTPFKSSGSGSLASMLSTPKAKACSSSPKQTSANTSTPSIVGESPLSAIKSAPIDSYNSRISILFLDEIDALGSHESHSLNQQLIKHFLCEWIDRKHREPETTSYGSTNGLSNFVVIGTTNRPGDVDVSLRAAHRLGKEIVFPASTTTDREQLICQIIDSQLRQLVMVIPGCKFSSSWAGTRDASVFSRSSMPELSEHLKSRLAPGLAAKTGGYSAADITALVGDVFQSTLGSLRDSVETKEIECQVGEPHDVVVFDISITAFERSMVRIPPSCLRSASVAKPPENLSYDDVIGYDEAKKCLRRVLGSYGDPILAQKLKKFNVAVPGGVLLHGPPGNSKTVLVMAAANSHGLPVIAVSSADIYSVFVGGAEAEVRRVFQMARQSAPCILFFDEIDTLAANRALLADTGEGAVESRVLATFLTEMDGVDANGAGGVIVIGTTNRIDNIDAALLRKGRLHNIVEMKNPTLSERLQLLLHFGNRYGLDAPSMVSLEDTVRRNWYRELSGAEVQNMCQEAAINLIRSKIIAKEQEITHVS